MGAIFEGNGESSCSLHVCLLSILRGEQSMRRLIFGRSFGIILLYRLSVSSGSLFLEDMLW